ncbi:Putative short-chain dehydrogenase/reductase SDR, NAD(P)-binding domain superfamily [Colletotrichum destructivum]|uniref:Short-chain dehydrogenase/reductase SDR, NAD(P)-binding domain superfamily n=1 Tax=Colletotrichum destructivum TaxID=34406 RepID=A0AAX4IQ10_9PEZI|nr:Putative short-chain dehydrogenase/reductase SDR, NAD(P)-binding domain superfamily [Colletotrichum destructivum]
MALAEKKIILITGANQGIGYEAAKNLILSSSEYHVVLGSRNSANGETAARQLGSTPGVKGSVATTQIDVTDEASVNDAVSRLVSEYGRLDVLVNNAGIISMAHPPTTGALRRVLDTNVIGALGVTEAFLPLLKNAVHKPARIVFVSSSMGSITHASDPTSPYYTPFGTEYKVSKAALNMLMTMYVVRLKPEGILVFGADPGLCATNFTGDPTSLTARGAALPADGGDRVAAVIKTDKLEDAGKVIGIYGFSPW